MNDQRGMYALADGTIISNTHPADQCAGPIGCPLHAPSGHALRAAPLVHYPPSGGLGRRCLHGQDHPDIDDIAWRERGATQYAGRRPTWFHEPCDGCCGLDQTYWRPAPEIDDGSPCLG